MVQGGAGTKNITSYRVIYGDTDQMGVVYYANYLRWFEKGRSEFFRQIGLPYTQIEDRGYYFPVTEVSCRYFKPARYDDQITITTQLGSFGRATLNFEYTISREAETLSLASGSTKHACVGADGRITRIPDAVSQLLAKALATPTDRPFR
jgi:acyl-CoA thioester hydrolase